MTRTELEALLSRAEAKPLLTPVLWELRPRGFLWTSNRGEYEAAREALLRSFLQQQGGCYLQIDVRDVETFPDATNWPNPLPGLFQVDHRLDTIRLEHELLQTGDYLLYCCKTPVPESFWQRDWWKFDPQDLVDALTGQGISGCIVPFSDDIEWRVFLSPDFNGVAG
jgi:hypothetical protein